MSFHIERLGDACTSLGMFKVDKYCTYINPQVPLQHGLFWAAARSWDTGMKKTKFFLPLWSFHSMEITYEVSVVTAFSNENFLAVFCIACIVLICRMHFNSENTKIHKKASCNL